MADGTNHGRRGVLKVAVVGGVIGCGALAVPSVRFLVAPAGGGAGPGRWIKTLSFDSLREGEPKRVALIADHRDAWTLEKAVELGAAWLVRRGDAVLAWSVTCPHLGCAIDRSASAPGFSCPCHESSFDVEGARLSGPSLRGLDSLSTRLQDGFVMVKFQRFRQGIPEKVAAG